MLAAHGINMATCCKTQRVEVEMVSGAVHRRVGERHKWHTFFGVPVSRNHSVGCISPATIV